ncbi:MAG: esterase-like activity of phytase family protein, partial [Geminicoccaceae bacterium]
MIAVSDQGHLFNANLVHDAQGVLTGIDDRWSRMDIPRRPDDPHDVRAFDAEALTADGAGGLVIAYEGHHRLRRLLLDDLHRIPARLPLPDGLGGPSNSGMETLATLEGGRLLAIAERVGAWGGVGLSAWLVDDERAHYLVYVPEPNFVPTGGDRLDDRLFVLERQFSMLGGFRNRIAAVSTADIKPDAHLEGETLAIFRWGDFGQNFEAIAARRAPDGRLLLYLLSDDNFSMLQQTLLLQLSLPSTPIKDALLD